MQHLLTLYPRILAVLSGFGHALASLAALRAHAHGGSGGQEADIAYAGVPRVEAVCQCVRVLVESLASCLDGIDSRDVDLVYDAVVGTAAVGTTAERLAALGLEDKLRPVAAAMEGQDSAGDVGAGDEGCQVGLVGQGLPASIYNIRDSFGSFSTTGKVVAVVLGQNSDAAGVTGSGGPVEESGPAGPTPQMDRCQAVRCWSLSEALDCVLAMVTGGAGDAEDRQRGRAEQHEGGAPGHSGAGTDAAIGAGSDGQGAEKAWPVLEAVAAQPALAAAVWVLLRLAAVDVRRGARALREKLLEGACLRACR